MELLILLVGRQGELVSRDEMIAKLWGRDVFIETEHGINTAVRKIRQTWETTRSDRGSCKPWSERDTALLPQLAPVAPTLGHRMARNQNTDTTRQSPMAAFPGRTRVTDTQEWRPA